MLPCLGKIPKKGRCKIEKPMETSVYYLKIDLRKKREKNDVFLRKYSFFQLLEKIIQHAEMTNSSLDGKAIIFTIRCVHREYMLGRR